jgi:uncharacterized protein (TIGR02246 family)
MFSRLTSTTLTAMAALTACQQPETAEQMHARMQMESDSARVAIEAQVARFTAAFGSRQADGMAALYAPNGVVMPPDMPAISGRDNIRAGFEAMFAPMPEGATLALRIDAVTANGPIAVERGMWTITMPGPDGTSTEAHGKYLVEWQKTEGEWLMVSDIWNNDAPPPTETPQD